MTSMQSQNLAPDRARKYVCWWLALCLALVALMLVVGGLTRMTESGLSIVEWKPLRGTVPPMSETAWQEEFDLYKDSPQYKKVFPDMELEQFKDIFWLEYLHRLLGRIIGLVFLFPLLWFAYTRAITARRTLLLGSIFMLGALQGVFGWLMVATGLENEPRVSPYMLALHLSTCFVLFALIQWQLMTLSNPHSGDRFMEMPQPSGFLKAFAVCIVCVILLQVVYGALVAGLRAGLTYNTFPLMDGRFIPEGLWPSELWYINLFEDVTSVQFIHRMLAYGLSAAIVFFWAVGRNNPHIAHILPILFVVLTLQFLLGVLTLIFVVPIPLASLHQANALLLFAVAVAILHRLYIPRRILFYELAGKSAIPV